MVYVPRVRCNRFLITHLPLEFQLETRVFKLVLRMVQDLIYPTQANTVMQEDRLVLWWAPLILMDSFICKAHHRTITLPQIYLSLVNRPNIPDQDPCKVDSLVFRQVHQDLALTLVLTVLLQALNLLDHLQTRRFATWGFGRHHPHDPSHLKLIH